MSPQLLQIAECLNEANIREIKIARCLAESLKRIQELEQFKTEAGQQAEEVEKKFNANAHDISEQLAKLREESSITVQGLSEQIISEKEHNNAELGRAVDVLSKANEQAKIDLIRLRDTMVAIPAELAAIKAELAVPATQPEVPKSFNPRGAYEPGEKYKPFDYVSSNGSSYIALVENPTEPPSKKSKQWMLVAARGASGNGGIISASEVVGLGTAATRDVGQLTTNIPELSGNGILQLGDSSSGTFNGKIRFYDIDADRFAEVYTNDTQVKIENTSGGVLTYDGNSNSADLIFSALTDFRQYEFPDKGGTIALISDVGDRYLTSSTTSLLIGNGAKTLTVGTGLAYSPTQDVTIAYDVSNHMHAVVTSYNSTTGVLAVDVQQHTGSGTHTAWTVNVGGIALGTLPTDGAAGTVLTKATSANYDTVWSTPSVAVGGITGLGTGVATALAVNVGSSGAPVVFNGVGGTPSSITLTNATGYPAATTTTAGITAVGIASPQSPVSTNAARISQVTAFGRLFNSVLFTDFLGGGYSGSPGTASDGYVFGTGVSGTGSAIAKLNAHVSGHAGILLLTTGTTTTGYSAYDTFNSSNTFRYDDGETVFEAVVRLPVLSTVTDEYSFAIGGSPQNNGVLGNDGAMFYYKRVSYGANWQAVTRNTASQTTTDTAVAVAANTWVRLTLIVNAAGTSVTYYINETLVATITTNIPAGGAGREGCLLLKSAGTTSVTANVDYHFVGKTFTTSR